jgi:hypothetical protein
MARVIGVDPISKKITLSNLPHLVNFTAINSKDTSKFQENINKVLNKVKVTQSLQGNSFNLDLAQSLPGFLHSTHTKSEESKIKD